MSNNVIQSHDIAQAVGHLILTSMVKVIIAVCHSCGGGSESEIYSPLVLPFPLPTFFPPIASYSLITLSLAAFAWLLIASLK
jgi:hypothetical protein